MEYLLSTALGFLQQTPEYLEWGRNWETLALFLTIFFTLPECWSTWEQDRKIRRYPEKEGQSLSVIFLLFETAFVAAFLQYGEHKKVGCVLKYR